MTKVNFLVFVIHVINDVAMNKTINAHPRSSRLDTSVPLGGTNYPTTVLF
ncbi:MAG TPA: hypothetical protein PLP19_21110 [bacterium]|nr:hypothetical protein [bacterium]HPN45997.1 hypothetical protein [bacterium]